MHRACCAATAGVRQPPAWDASREAFRNTTTIGNHAACSHAAEHRTKLLWLSVLTCGKVCANRFSTATPCCPAAHRISGSSRLSKASCHHLRAFSRVWEPVCRAETAISDKEGMHRVAVITRSCCLGQIMKFSRRADMVGSIPKVMPCEYIHQV